MSRKLIGLAIAVAAARTSDASAQPAPAAADAAAPNIGDEIGDQLISVEAGLMTGGSNTPGGLRIAGHFLYQLSDEDYFDGVAGFTFGSSRAACFRDRSDAVICDHGVTDGAEIEVVLKVRHWFAPHGAFRPFAHVGVGFGLARFGDDNVSGVTIPAHGGGGVRLDVTPSIGVVVEDELELGIGMFNRGVNSQLQVGFLITGGVEFRLR